MNSYGQEPDKVGQMLDVVGKFGNRELLDGLSKATGIQWEAETANRLFKYGTEGPSSPDQLNLGKYENHPDIVKVASSTYDDSGKAKYVVDIASKRYLQQGANLFQNIKNYNNDLKNAEIEFTINGSPLPDKSINL